MFFFKLIVGLWILPIASTLNCYQCAPELFGSCTKTTECPPNNQCGSTRYLAFGGGTKLIDLKSKSCVPAEVCLGFSFNLGFMKSEIRTKCCNTELCNTTIPDYNSVPNGKKCFSCEGQSCTETVYCEGDQDYCIKAKVDLGGIPVVKGCVSKLVCTNTTVEMLKQYGPSEITCCQGNYCNSASRTRVGLLLLVVPLISVVLFN